MANMTLSIPDDIKDRMRKYPEVKWSEVVRRAIIDYLERLSTGEELEMSHFSELATKEGVDVSEFPLDEALTYSENMRKMEWKRHSTTRTS